MKVYKMVKTKPIIKIWDLEKKGKLKVKE